MSNLSQEFCCRLLDACIVAYKIKNGSVPDTSPNYNAIDIKSGTAPVGFVDGPQEINAGFVAETVDDMVVVAFRGTLTPHNASLSVWLEDWLNDFDAGPMPWVVDSIPYGHVETGFGKSVLNLWPFVKSALANIDMTNIKGIAVTGHSKGGGMTFPTASLIKAEYPNMQVEVCAFAAPMTCDREFLESYTNQGLNDLSFRYQSQYDIVPFLPDLPQPSSLIKLKRLFLSVKNEYPSKDLLPKLENYYVRPGTLRYLTKNCQIETGKKGQKMADHDILHALEHFDFKKIAEAHPAGNHYYSCVCGTHGTDAEN